MGKHRSFDISEIEAYSERVDSKRVPGPNRLIIERHRPTKFDMPFHHHTSVEINYLQDCQMTYSFSGHKAVIVSNRLTIFWGAAPHRVTDVTGQGLTTNIYLSLGQFLRWSLPKPLVDAVLSGCVVTARPNPDMDVGLMNQLFAERDQQGGAWRKVHLSELETRLRRIGLEGWDTALSAPEVEHQLRRNSAAMLHVEAMLRFIADNFSRPITVSDVVKAVNLSQGHAMKLFRDIMGASIKEQLTRSRLSHARMLLSDTDQKVLTVALDSGFKTLSSFYEAFVQANGVSPGKYRRNLRVDPGSA
jgi:AraC-like DNA-binding protein